MSKQPREPGPPHSMPRPPAFRPRPLAALCVGRVAVSSASVLSPPYVRPAPTGAPARPRRQTVQLASGWGSGHTAAAASFTARRPRGRPAGFVQSREATRRKGRAQVVGFILLSALQRRRRGIHISTMLRPEAQPAHTTLAELQAARGTSIGGRGAALEVMVPPGPTARSAAAPLRAADSANRSPHRPLPCARCVGSRELVGYYLYDINFIFCKSLISSSHFFGDGA